jgi:hypothetical protein
VALFLGLAAVQQRRDGWAGLCLAVTTIKPQMIFLVLIFLLAWALFQHRWRLILSFSLSMLGLVGSSLLLIPTWLFDFARNAVDYSDYVAFGTPLENLLHYFLPAGLAAPLTVALSGLFFLALLPGWWLALRNRPGGYSWALHTTLIVGSLITFRSATTNQVILYLPLFFLFHRFTGLNKANLRALLVEIGLFGLMWGMFGATLAGNWENVMMHGLLPALMLLWFALDWRALWAAARQLDGERLAGAPAPTQAATLYPERAV